MSNKTLWMRWVSFQKLRDLLLIIAELDGVLSAKELHNEGVKKGTLISTAGKPLSPTTTYHYRTILQRLGLVRKDKGKYHINKGNDHIWELLDTGRIGHPLSYEEKRILANIVIAHEDCRYWFFDLFLPTRRRNYDLARWTDEGTTVSIPGSLRKLRKGKASEPILIRSSVTSETRLLDTTDKVQAILWGIRLWCTEQLEIADELFVLNQGYDVFPVHHPDKIDRQVTVRTILNSIHPEDEWTTLRVPDMTSEWAPKLRIAARELHQAFVQLRNTLPGLIDFVPTTVAFIAMATPFQRRDRAILNSYLHDSEGDYISHIRLHRKVWESINTLTGLRG